MPDATATTERTLENIQANLLRPSKSKGPRQRDWSLFLFFRILPEAEMGALATRAKEILKAPSSSRSLDVELAKLRLDTAGLVEQKRQDAAMAPGTHPAAVCKDPDGPAKAFLDWLKALVEADGQALRERIGALAMTLGPHQDVAPISASGQDLGAFISEAIGLLLGCFEKNELDLNVLAGGLVQLMQRFGGKDYRVAMAEVRAQLPREKSPLPMTLLYEVLRQAAPAFLESGEPPTIRGEAREAKRDMERETVDCAPINIALSYPGLQALKVDALTLASLPDAFRDGMAARAALLGDTGDSAPKSWYGELGRQTVHGYFAAGFTDADAPTKDNGELTTGADDVVLTETFWKALRGDIAAFNEPLDPHGEFLRLIVGLLFLAVGLEVLHIELGQETYEVDGDGRRIKMRPRREHFGFREGISQPRLRGLENGAAIGGGTPCEPDDPYCETSNGRAWKGVAAGEIFLSEPDEDGQDHSQPIDPTLRLGSTFLVFRKLEQKVGEFRQFLADEDPGGQRKLAAQFMGRQETGEPLIASAGAGSERSKTDLNDFLYQADDPDGLQCPLGAHIRRANPRDITFDNGGDVRHHRILRRGISYGGSRLAERDPGNGEEPDPGSGEEPDPGSGEERGLLFVAANARIDMQFEVVQGQWINTGEFLGQAGLGRCPVTGANNKSVEDRFVGTRSAGLVTGLPRFVVTRGGDYFYAPGVEALKAIAQGEGRFKPKAALPFFDHSMAEASSPALWDKDRLTGYGRAMMRPGGPGLIRVAYGDGARGSAVFVARHSDVANVLSGEVKDHGVDFSVEPFRDLASGFLGKTGNLIFATDASSDQHARLMKITNAAWDALAAARGPIDIAAVVGPELEASLERVGQAKVIDVVGDVAVPAAYAVLEQIFGTPRAPELPAQIQQGQIELAQEIAAPPGAEPLQMWSVILLANLLGNVEFGCELRKISNAAGGLAGGYVGAVLAGAREKARSTPDFKPANLIEAFAYVEGGFTADYAKLPKDETETDPYGRDASLILVELMGATLATVPLTFGFVMEYLLDNRIDLATLLPTLKVEEVERLVLEAERLNPCGPVRMRRCARDARLGSGEVIHQGEFVTALVKAATRDPTAFAQPCRFSLGLEKQPDRDLDSYLLFGAANSAKFCWGKDRVAMPILRACLAACGRLKGLRRIAGDEGDPQNLVGVRVSLPARFSQVAAP